MTNRQIESQKNFERAKSLVEGGSTIGEAVKEAKISMATWYDKIKKERQNSKPPRAQKGKKHAYVDLPAAHQAPRIAIVVTTADALKDVLKGLL